MRALSKGRLRQGEAAERLGLGVTRRQWQEEIDRTALKPLPPEPYEFCEWRIGRVGIDYHVEIGAHYTNGYSDRPT